MRFQLTCGVALMFHSQAIIILSFVSLRVDKALLKMDPAKAMLNYANGMVLSFIHLLITVALNGV